ncbi:unnamed protein product, partial [marine sediment metagenome]
MGLQTRDPPIPPIPPLGLITDLSVSISIASHPDWRWNMEGLSWNPNITPEFVERHLDWEWDWMELSQNL